tara:strand:+ start:190 stop:408 length:219 start_codon:yes stop_codon:yes gene_type:complete
MQKKSLTILGHKTSLSLEKEFWQIINQISLERNISIPKILELIDENNNVNNLASAARVYALKYLCEKINITL